MIPWSECLCLSNIRMLKRTPEDDHMRRWGLWEMLSYKGGALMSEINALYKRPHRDH